MDGIQMFIKKNNHRIWLFPQIKDSNKNINKDQFSTYCKRTFGEGITPSTLRSIYVSQVVTTKSAEQREHIAQNMGHSIATQNITYSQYNNVLHPEVCTNNHNDTIDIVDENDDTTGTSTLQFSTDIIKCVTISQDVINKIQFRVKNGNLIISSAI
jgi:hypothetical protein